MTIQEPKFLIDTALQRLGRWLRAAGYDAVFIDELSDFTQQNTSGSEQLELDYYKLRKAINEGRFLLTDNPSLADMRRAQGTVFLIDNESLEEAVETLCAFLNINWNFRPFSRCMVCNSEIGDLPKSGKMDNIFCPSCKQMHWDTAHSERMQVQLNDWYHKFSH